MPKPDALGRVRPCVGNDDRGKAVKFQVGNVKDTTQQEMQRRLDNIRLLYQCSCREYGIDYWAGWALPWAKRLEKGNVKVHGSSAAHANRGAQETHRGRRSGVLQGILGVMS